MRCARCACCSISCAARPWTRESARRLPTASQMVEHRLGIRTELAIENGIQIDPAAEQELFWLVSEALNNVVKHAGAEHVS